MEISLEELGRLAKSYNEYVYIDLRDDDSIRDIADRAEEIALQLEEKEPILKDGKAGEITWIHYPEEFQKGLTVLDMETNYLSAVERAAAISDMTDDQVIILYAFCETEEETEWYGSFLEERGIKV